MMKHYVLATQQQWGVKVFDTLKSRGGEWWLTRTVAGLRASITRNVRYVFCVNFSSYVPSDVLASAEIVNFHCTALPYGRGGGPIEQLLLRGHTETVITAHRMVAALDSGDIYGQSQPVSLAGTKEQILDRFVAPCVDLIRWIVETEPEPYPQVGDVITFKRLPKAEYEAFWRSRV